MKPLFTFLFLAFTMAGLAQTRDTTIQPDPTEIDKISIEEPKIVNKSIQNAETLPFFPGGPDAFMSYVAKNIVYPESARVKAINGKVTVQFVIEKDGSLSAIKVVQSLSSAFDKEAIRVIKNSPKWNPGMQNGSPVRVLYTLPVYFSLN